ncbi:hypothetical protein [Agromyces humi]|uniref:hypothetical protein n=1 Tax=Agromyces humi TaxID=1766800 RepID=UPI00135782D5|nr:hypothetical protein [Agromyces humi]
MLAAQEQLFKDLAEHQRVAGITDEHVAEQLGVDVEMVPDIVNGRQDLTMSELRYLGIALEVAIDYGVQHSRSNTIVLGRLAGTEELARQAVAHGVQDRLDGADVAIHARQVSTVTDEFTKTLLTELARRGARNVIVRGASAEFLAQLERHRHPSVHVTVLSGA